MDVSLDKKIDALFSYRKFPELLQHVGVEYKQSSFILKLKALQMDIYYLDHYLESNWSIDSGKIDDYWKNIQKSLDDCFSNNKGGRDYLNHILKYQIHELQLRDHKLPTRFKLNYFYFYKSCDVKLIRRLIYDRYPSLNSLIKLSDWRYFDYITEINDDIEDVFEDQETINANAFLLSVITKGILPTNEVFMDFLEHQKKNIGMLSNSLIKTMSNGVLTDTIQLLKTQNSKLSKPNAIPRIKLEQFIPLKRLV